MTETNETTTTGDPAPYIPPQSAYRWSSKTTPKLDAALAKAQGEMRAAHQNRTNDFLKSSYADMNSVIQAVRDACSSHGIARYQSLFTDLDNNIVVTTRIAHEGEWVEADFYVRVEEVKGLKLIQAVGNAITYVKRYALTAMLGISSGEDDDGNSAPEPDQWGRTVEALGKVGGTAERILAWAGISDPRDMTEDMYSALRDLHGQIRAGKLTVRQALTPRGEGQR